MNRKELNIVVLDGYTLNPGDLSWEGLERLGRVTVYERTPADEIASRAREADIVLTNKTPLTAEVIASLPQLQYIGVLATGYNIVDVAAARKAGIPVTNVPSYSSMSVVQTTFGLLLELCMRIGRHDEAVHRGMWANSPDFSFTVSPLAELQGKTFGIVGYGDIGQAAATVAAAFGMRVVIASRTRKPVQPGIEAEWMELSDLLETADVVSLHCPLTPDTTGLIRKETLARMKPTALLLNTSRGGLVDEQALADALNRGEIAGCGLDVLSTEPPAPDNPLLTARNAVITPHIAWSTKEARTRLMDTAVANVAAFLGGSSVNVVNQSK